MNSTVAMARLLCRAGEGRPGGKPEGGKGDGHLPGLGGTASGREACSARAMPTDPILPVLGLSRGHGEAFQQRSDLATPWFNDTPTTGKPNSKPKGDRSIAPRTHSEASSAAMMLVQVGL